MNLALCSVILYLSVHTTLVILLMKKLKLGKVTQFVQIHTERSFNPLLVPFLPSDSVQVKGKSWTVKFKFL